MRSAILDDERALDQLLHDLMSPISAVLLWEDVLRHSHDAEQRDKALSAIKQSAKLQARMIGDFRDLLRAQRGTLDLAKLRIPVASLVQPTIDRLRARGVALTAALDREAMVNADSVRLGQAFDRMLNHAADRAGSAGMLVELAQRGTEVVLRIHCPPPLVDAPPPPSASSLGIAVARALVALHDGELAIDDHALTLVARLPTTSELDDR